MRPAQQQLSAPARASVQPEPISIGRRSFLKINALLLVSPLFRIRYSIGASGMPCGYITVDMSVITVDSTLINVAMLLDSDCDGIADTLETGTYGTDPLNPDSDGDGLSDGDEISHYHTSPLNPDTDGDGISDSRETAAGTDPNDADAFPAVRGDINGDGRVDAGDLVLERRLIDGDLTVTPELLEKGDVAPLINGIPAPDGRLTASDYLVLQRKILGLIDF